MYRQSGLMLRNGFALLFEGTVDTRGVQQSWTIKVGLGHFLV